MVSGLLIGNQIGNPWLAFLMGVISHFVLDAIPHDIRELNEWQNRDNNKKKQAIEGYFDAFFILLLTIFLLSINKLSLGQTTVSALVGVFMPDLLWIMPWVFNYKNKWLEKYENFHLTVHKLIYKKIYITAWIAIPLQLAFFLILFSIYLSIE
ncbi:hypothetical protein COV56_02855 [Candidatus Kuenenbacteria bacterium CG11_big_fil_rev_8_21_14_0_20_37_9]|uniref:Uncharacterized protein n=2 Tax=Candidatus Kueneniibacteriota TaxID=1752740 RepID=A0A2M6XRZ0_9BACT|nr:MAG: hypothetical protein AUJ29_01065 [Candidatus Kuenenbacteria bacterium CG1_02_38_13]PIR05450.1 MAG: hypothetical protein COV56_02855 [Candidatus Kuenenbacteria bacterium CG11_big_fil_rev_8_21_14_0_20_37_9]PIU10393.1 MAG: hypothetical protein COT27_03415 [Candidatus Kuenenbacteria bacterium CG08_land_8_20_14_0_20_37_23]